MKPKTETTTASLAVVGVDIGVGRLQLQRDDARGATEADAQRETAARGWTARGDGDALRFCSAGEVAVR